MNFKDLFTIKQKLESFREELKDLKLEVQSNGGSKLGIREGMVYFNLSQNDWQQGVLSLELVLQNLIQQLLAQLKEKLSSTVKNSIGLDIGL